MTINHHPSAELLLEYSAGNVSGGNAVCISTHLELCHTCRIAHQRNNAIGGALIDKIDAHKVSEQLKSKIFNHLLDSETPSSITVSTISSVAKVDADTIPTNQVKQDTKSKIPRALRSFVPEGYEHLNWGVATGSAKSCLLFKDELGAVVSLLKIKPGGKISHHRHMGDEYTLILSGSFSDEDGLYSKGDFMLRNNAHQHTPIATKDRECICLTVQEAPLQFTGRLWRILNPFIRKSFQPI